MKLFSKLSLLAALILASPMANAAYCTASGGGNYEYIANVKVADLDNASSGLSAYTDYTSLTANLAVGANAVTLTPGFVNNSYIEHWAVYIDFNKDEDFSDAGEKVMTGSGSSSVNGTITVPTNASGTTRMRVLMKYNQAVPGPCGGLTSGEVEDYTVSFSGGTPNVAPVARTDGPYSAEKGVGVAMSSNDSSDSDGNIVSWLWNFGDGSTSNSPNPNHVYNTAGTYTVTLTVTDDDGATGTTTTTATITDGTTPPPGNYCTSSGGGTYEWIAGVKVANLNNTSSGATPYTDFTNKTANLKVGANTITLTPGFNNSAYTEHWAVWIDFNKDGDFADSGEKLTGTLSGNAAVTATLNVPASASDVTTRMRVSMKYNAAVTGPCENFSYGEVEDYTVTIGDSTNPPPPTDMPDMCATSEPTTETSLTDGVPVCVKSTSQFTSFSIAGVNNPTSIAITTAHGLGNLTLEARNGGGWPKPGDDSVRSKHVGNTECVIINNPTEYWTNSTLRGLFKGATIVADLNATECRATPGASDPGNTGYQYNSVNVLIYPFNFNGTPLEWTTAQINEEMQKTKQYYDEQSYGNFNVTWEIKPAIYISDPKSKYDNDKSLWNPTYKEKLIEAGTDPSFPGEATIIMVAAPPIGTEATNYINSQAGPPLMEIYTYKAGTIAHEMGHALGLRHSMSVEGGNSIINSGNDTITNYGNVHAMMGMGAHTLEEYNLMFKSYFKDWVKDSDVPVITSSGTYRIYAFDHGTASGTNAPGNIGIRLKSGNGLYTYWLEYRTTNDRYNARTKNGVLVNIQGYMENESLPSFWNHRSALLDMTPNSQSTANWALEDETDAELAIGKSFTDPWSGFRITPTAKGGAEDTANAWIEVNVEIF
ncbi:GEVED domain-containing protein [Aliikangiella coralliicola]|uniref:PKD domain-containing protein n=1 Tax=Aliikangiella coralliicola TaxID=2592383 RepID=A0A545UDR5_9GAMM|nr:GEVED domain-containing protein [Aliikangiella coralliicola]TQV87607.1 PKD domain-containing protein [Aliikangiella coralliicola]